jgi:hypothetical protein
LVRPERLGHKVYRGYRDYRGRLELPGQRDLKEFKVCKGYRVQLVHKEYKDLKGYKAHKDRLEIREQQERLVRGLVVRLE